jgi:hypothetical protein
MTENYLYFAESAVETGGASSPEAMLIPASSYLGCDPESTTITNFKFKALDGTATIETVALTHTASKNKDVIKAFVNIVNSNFINANGVTIVADSEVIGTKKFAEYHSAFNGLVTGCAIA